MILLFLFGKPYFIPYRQVDNFTTNIMPKTSIKYTLYIWLGFFVYGGGGDFWRFEFLHEKVSFNFFWEKSCNFPN